MSLRIFPFPISSRFSRVVTSLVFVAIGILQPVGLNAQCVDYGDYLHVAGSVGFWDPVKEVAVDGSIAYVLLNTGWLFVLDLADPLNPEVMSGPVRCEATLLKAEGPRLFCLHSSYYFGGKLSIFDVSDPYDPHLMSSLAMPGEGMDFDLASGHVFVADGDAGLQVVDVSDPANPVIVASLTSRGELSHLAIRGTMAYVFGYYYPDLLDYINVIDISDPSDPRFLAYEPAHNVLDMEIQDNVIYCGTTTRLSIFEIGDHDPSIVDFAGELRIPAYNVQVTGDRVFMIGRELTEALFVVDVEDPANPVAIDRIGLGPSPGGLAACGDFILAGGNEMLHMVGARNDASPALGFLPEVPERYALDEADDLVLCVQDDLTVVDVSIPGDWRVSGECFIPGFGTEMKIQGRYAYIAGTVGLSVVNFRDPENPYCCATLSTIDPVEGIDVAGDRAYLATAGGWFVVVDVQTPSSPVPIGSIDLGECNMDVAVGEGVAYVTGYHRWYFPPSLFIIDLTDPQALNILSDSPSGMGALEVAGNLVYTGWNVGYSGFSVVDVQDPYNPAILASYPTTNLILDFELRGDFLYLADNRGGVQIFGARDPLAMERLGGIGPGLLNGQVRGVAANSRYLFFSDIDRGLGIAPLPCNPGALSVEITAGSEPRVVPAGGGTFPYRISITNQGGAGIRAEVRIEATFPDGVEHQLHERRDILLPPAYTVGSYDLFQTVPASAPEGLYHYRCTVDQGDGFLASDEFTFEKLPGAAKQLDQPMSGDAGWILTGWDAEGIPSVAASAGGLTLSCSPNPFNPATVLSFELPGPGPVTLQVYDVAGRLVRTLADRVPFAGGSQELAWNGGDDQGKPAPAGVYFYRLGFRDEWRTGRMVMVK